MIPPQPNSHGSALPSAKAPPSMAAASHVLPRGTPSLGSAHPILFSPVPGCWALTPAAPLQVLPMCSWQKNLPEPRFSTPLNEVAQR